MPHSDDRGPWLSPRRAAVFVLPLAVYLILTQVEPTASNYPLTYSLKLGLTGLALLLCWPTYLAFPRPAERGRWVARGLVLGAVGAAIWIGLCRVGAESWISEQLAGWGLGPASASRAAFNPWEAFPADSPWLWAFLAIRFTGLVLVVPCIEEFFLRGFLLRYLESPRWWETPVGSAGLRPLAAAALYGAVTHPGEWIAAAIWFAGVGLLVQRTRNVWDAVAVHAVTNLLLGLYVITWQDWRLW